MRRVIGTPIRDLVYPAHQPFEQGEGGVSPENTSPSRQTQKHRGSLFAAGENGLRSPLTGSASGSLNQPEDAGQHTSAKGEAKRSKEKEGRRSRRRGLEWFARRVGWTGGRPSSLPRLALRRSHVVNVHEARKDTSSAPKGETKCHPRSSSPRDCQRLRW